MKANCTCRKGAVCPSCLGLPPPSSSSTRSGSIAVALPVAGSQSSTTPSSLTPPFAGLKRTGIPVRMRWIASSASTPMTESCGPGHARVRDRRGASGLDARVRGLHVRVGADDRRHAPVEHPGDRDLLARRLGVEVDEHDVRVLPRLVDHAVEHLERAL